MLGDWLTRTLHRMVMAVDWAAKLSSDMEDQGHQRNDDVSIRHLRMRGNDNTSRVRNALLNQLQPVANNRDREIWVTLFATELLDAMAVEQVANMHEVKSAFPDCVVTTQSSVGNMHHHQAYSYQMKELRCYNFSTSHAGAATYRQNTKMSQNL